MLIAGVDTEIVLILARAKECEIPENMDNLTIGLGWDDEVPNETKNKWIELFKELTLSNGIKFDCCLKSPNALDDPWIIILSDTSRLGQKSKVKHSQETGKRRLIHYYTIS